jgi:glycerophosphoryl diester phosphodiesterase
VIAHRGASAHAPENTLPAFRRALELGAFEVELDVQLSRDDVLMLFHDSTLDAKTGLEGPVRAHDASALRAAEIGSWFDREHPEMPWKFAGTRLIALEDLFATFGAELYYHVEIKGPEEAIPRLLLERAAAQGLERRVTVTSFSPEQLERVRALDPGIATGLLLGSARRLRKAGRLQEGPEGGASLVALHRHWIDRAARAGFNQVGLRSRDLTREVVTHGHARGLEVRAWGVGTSEDMEHAIQVGSNGMTIDWPERLIRRMVALLGGDDPSAAPSRHPTDSQARPGDPAPGRVLR